MTNERMLGKIQDISIGYWDGRFAMRIAIGSDSEGWGAVEFIPVVYTNDIVAKLKDSLCDSKKREMRDLIGVPIEASFDGTKLVSWRVLREVI